MKTRKWFFLIFIFVSALLSASPASGIMRIMPLGDSITQGCSSGVDDEAHYISYRKALWERLTAEGYEIDFVGSLNSGWEEFDDADHEGHGGWSDDDIVGYLEQWLAAYNPDIILLHIGTNQLEESPDDVEDILDEIDKFNPETWVILARIINWNCSTHNPPCWQSYTTTTFNINVAAMAEERIKNLADKIIIVDMEDGAGLDYHLYPDGDMFDNAHPYETGYEKMAEEWFLGLEKILPVANAGPYQTVGEGAPVTLDGSGSYDPDDGIASYLWEQEPEPSVTLSDTSAVQPTFIAPDVDESGASLTFKLTVTDRDGLEHSDICMVNVTVNQSPIANAGPYQTVGEGAPVTLDGSGSYDPDYSIASYQWIQISGLSVTLSDPASVKPTFTAPDVDENGALLTFQLTVTDNGGLQDSDTCIVNVNRVNQPLSAKELDENWRPLGCFISTMTRD